MTEAKSTPNCKDCRYLYWLAKMGCHVDVYDCDKYGTDLCEKMNNPDFIKFAKEMWGYDENDRCRSSEATCGSLLRGYLHADSF